MLSNTYGVNGILHSAYLETSEVPKRPKHVHFDGAITRAVKRTMPAPKGMILKKMIPAPKGMILKKMIPAPKGMILKKVAPSLKERKA